MTNSQEGRGPLVLVRFQWVSGRGGKVEGLFACTEHDLASLPGTEVSFGEILGKHSDVYGTIESDELTVISRDADLIAQLTAACGYQYDICGYNPLNYIIQDEEEDEEEDDEEYDWTEAGDGEDEDEDVRD